MIDVRIKCLAASTAHRSPPHRSRPFAAACVSNRPRPSVPRTSARTDHGPRTWASASRWAERTVHLAPFHYRSTHDAVPSFSPRSLARQQVTCTARLPVVFALRPAWRLQRPPPFAHRHQAPTAYAFSHLSSVPSFLRSTHAASPPFALPPLSLPAFPLSLPLPPTRPLPAPLPPSPPPYPKRTPPHPLSARAQLRLPPKRSGPIPHPTASPARYHRALIGPTAHPSGTSPLSPPSPSLPCPALAHHALPTRARAPVPNARCVPTLARDNTSHRARTYAATLRAPAQAQAPPPAAGCIYYRMILVLSLSEICRHVNYVLGEYIQH